MKYQAVYTSVKNRRLRTKSNIEYFVIISALTAMNFILWGQI